MTETSATALVYCYVTSECRSVSEDGVVGRFAATTIPCWRRLEVGPTDQANVG